MTDENTEAEVDDLIDAWHNGAGEGMSLHEFLGLTEEEYGPFMARAELPEGYTPPARFVRTGPSRVDPGQSLPDFYRTFDPGRPLATFILLLMGLGCIAWFALALLARWSRG